MYVHGIILFSCVIVWLIIGLSDEVSAADWVISSFILVLIFQLEDIKELLKKKDVK